MSDLFFVLAVVTVLFFANLALTYDIEVEFDFELFKRTFLLLIIQVSLALLGATLTVSFLG